MSDAVQVQYEPRGQMANLFKWALVDKKFPQGKIVEFLVEGGAGTGKSRMTGELVYSLMDAYPRCRILVVRQTRKALSESWMVTFEDKVLWPGHPMIGGARRENRHGYEHENGSVCVMGTMENPDNLYSTEWDVVIFEEALQSNLDAWEKFRRALRNWVMPFQLLIGCVNPRGSRHFLNLRCKTSPPKCNRIVTRHEDNPSLKPEYIESLAQTTGIRHKSLYLGEWGDVDGAVFPEYDTLKHLKFLKDIPYHPAIHGEQAGRAVKIRDFYAGVDWGYNDPGVITVWGMDTENKLWLVNEVYQTRQGIPFWADMCVELDKKYKFARMFCDPSQPAMIDLFNTSISELRGRPLGPAGVACKAENSWQAGVEAIRERLISGSLFLRHDSLVSCNGIPVRDKALVDAARPTCLAEELPDYAYMEDVEGKEQKGRARDREDPRSVAHAIDTTRYLCLSLLRHDERPIGSRENYAPGTYGELTRHWEIFEDDCQ